MIAPIILGISAVVAFIGCAARREETQVKSTEKAPEQTTEQANEDSALNAQCPEPSDPLAFMKAVNVNPDDSRFTIDSDPSTADIDNPHLTTECIYDCFSRLSPTAQLVVLEELDKNMQYETMRNLILHSMPGQSPDSYCQGMHTDLVDVILKKRYASYPHGSFLSRGEFSRWLQSSINPNGKTMVERMMKLVPSQMRLRQDYEIFYESNQYNEPLSVAMVFSKNRIETHFEAVRSAIRNVFGQYLISSTLSRENILHSYPSDIVGDLWSLSVSFIPTKKPTAADRALIDQIRRDVGRSFAFKKGINDAEDVDVFTNDAGEFHELAFAVKLNAGVSPEEQSQALKSLVLGILSRANQMAVPSRYAISFFTIAKSQGNPESIIVHVNKQGAQQFGTGSMLMSCKRLFRASPASHAGENVVFREIY